VESEKRSHASKIPIIALLILLALAQNVAEFLQRATGELGLGPEVGGKEAVGVDDGKEGSLEGVLEGLGGAGRGGIGVLDTSELKETLDSGRGNEAGTTGSGNKSDGDGTTLGALLDGQRVRLTEVGTPVTATDGENSELGDDDGGTDGSSDFLGGLDSETNVALRVTNDDDGLETGTLTGTGLLLDGFDLHNLILELGQEEVHDLVLLNGQRVEVDLLHAGDLASLDETAELGHGLPFLLLSLSSATATATAASTAVTTTVSARAESSTSTGSSVSHFEYKCAGV
jgi:hypothetical protein